METNTSGLTLRVPRAKDISFDIPFAKIALALFVAAALVFSYVYQQALVTQNTMEITELKERINEEKTLNEKLKVRAVVLSSPERLEELATDSLGMVKPESVGYILLPSGDNKSHNQNVKKRGVLSSLKSLLSSNGG